MTDIDLQIGLLNAAGRATDRCLYFCSPLRLRH